MVGPPHPLPKPTASSTQLLLLLPLTCHPSLPPFHRRSKLSQVIQDWTPNYCVSKKATHVTFSRAPKLPANAGGGAKTEVRRSEQWQTWLKEMEAAKKAARKA